MPLIALAMVAAGLLVHRGTVEASGLVGTALHGRPAPDFRLEDQNGKTVTLADLQGKAVALTFLYTDCPDVCPVITTKFKEAQQQLGAAAGRAALVAVTVDPESDTPARLTQYDQVMGMTGRWEFLTGTRQQLSPVWQAYYVQPVSLTLAKYLATPGAQPPKNTQVHSAPIFLIDPQGNEQALLDPDFKVGDLVHDLRRLEA